MTSPWNQSALFSQGDGDEDEKNHWATPPEVFAPLDRVFGFGLDVAARISSTKVPTSWVGPDHPDPTRRDAFSVEWPELSEGRPVWLNPPYGRGIDRWMEMASYWGERVTVAVLIFARTDTIWWWLHVLARDPKTGKRVRRPTGRRVPCAAEIRWRAGRLRFLAPDTGKPKDAAPAPSALVVFRPGYTGDWPVNGVLR